MKKSIISITSFLLVLSACSHGTKPKTTDNSQNANIENKKLLPVTNDGRCTQAFIDDWNLIANRSVSLVATLSTSKNDPSTEESQNQFQLVSKACDTYINNNLFNPDASKDAPTPVSCYAIKDGVQSQVTSDMALGVCTKATSLLKSSPLTTKVEVTGDSTDAPGNSGKICPNEVQDLNIKLRKDLSTFSNFYKIAIEQVAKKEKLAKSLDELITQAEAIEKECDQLAEFKITQTGCTLPLLNKKTKTLTAGMLVKTCLKVSYQDATLEKIRNPNALASEISALPTLSLIKEGELKSNIPTAEELLNNSIKNNSDDSGNSNDNNNNNSDQNQTGITGSITQLPNTLTIQDKDGKLTDIRLPKELTVLTVYQNSITIKTPDSVPVQYVKIPDPIGELKQALQISGSFKGITTSATIRASSPKNVVQVFTQTNLKTNAIEIITFVGSTELPIDVANPTNPNANPDNKNGGNNTPQAAGPSFFTVDSKTEKLMVVSAANINFKTNDGSVKNNEVKITPTLGALYAKDQRKLILVDSTLKVSPSCEVVNLGTLTEALTLTVKNGTTQKALTFKDGVSVIGLKCDNAISAYQFDASTSETLLTEK